MGEKREREQKKKLERGKRWEEGKLDTPHTKDFFFQKKSNA